MTSLIDRYVHAVLRAVPGRQRAELEPDIRSLVADTVEAHGGDERAALTELGDPTLLAARYADGPQHLIGPAVYWEWRRLVTLLLPIAPIVGSVVLAATLVGGSTVGEAIVAGLATGFNVALQTVFWVTVVFAAFEHFGRPEGTLRRGWTVDDLPELPNDDRSILFEAGFSIVFNILLIAGLLWVQLQTPIVLGGDSFPLFDPALWSFWLPWFIGVTVLEIVMLVTVVVRRRWTWGAAVANAVLAAAFALPAMYLLANDLLFDPALVAEVSERTGGGWFEPTMTAIAAVVGLVAVWDAFDGFRKARRASQAAAPA